MIFNIKMWFKKFLIRLFKRKYNCDKCNYLVIGNILCEKCQEFVDYTEIKRENEIKAKKQLERRTWIINRDRILADKNG